MGRISTFVWRSPFFPRKLSFTREGKAIFLISVGLGFAAVNTGNNLLYLVFGLSLSMILVSGVLSEWNVRNIWASLDCPTRAQAKVPTPYLVSLRKRKGRFPSYCISAWPLFEASGLKTTNARLLELKPREEASSAAYVTFERRGEYQLLGLAVATTFPFSFFSKAMVVQKKAKVLVWPHIDLTEAQSVHRSAPGDELEADEPGRGIEFFGAREFREGDNPKFILHRKSAGRTIPVVRETEATKRAGLWIILHNAFDPSKKSPEDVERAIERAASLAALEIGRGTAVGISAVGGKVDAGSGRSQLEAILDFLAKIEVYKIGRGDPTDLIEGPPRGFSVAVVTP